MNVTTKQLGLASLLLLLGGGLGIVGGHYLAPLVLSSARPPNPSLIPTQFKPLPIGNDSGNPNDVNFIAKAAQKVGPAVVRIDAAKAVADNSPPAEMPFAQPFFRRFFGKDAPIPREHIERGTGSGFILSSDGKLLTNAHVVEGSEQVRVTLKDGQVYDGKVVGVDAMTDVAVVKIAANNLPTVTLGDSNQLMPGEWAIAIGNPMGLDNTVTVGIISALGRSSSEVGVPDKRVRFIQTDAAINPGNSGGPLLNAQGEVIGVNTAIRADGQGLGFAIPIQTAQRIAEQLFQGGKVAHPYLGIHMVTLNPDLREELSRQSNLPFKVDQDTGVLIVDVAKNSPAAQAGFQAGDIILAVGEQKVQTAADVQEKVEASQIGQPLAVQIKRQQQEQIIAVSPGAFPQ